MSDYSKAAYPKTCSLVEAAGIDPHTVSAEDFNESGYSTFVEDQAQGVGLRRRLTSDTGEYIYRRHSWPLRVDVTSILAAFRSECGLA